MMKILVFYPIYLYQTFFTPLFNVIPPVEVRQTWSFIFVLYDRWWLPNLYTQPTTTTNHQDPNPYPPWNSTLPKESVSTTKCRPFIELEPPPDRSVVRLKYKSVCFRCKCRFPFCVLWFYLWRFRGSGKVCCSWGSRLPEGVRVSMKLKSRPKHTHYVKVRTQRKEKFHKSNTANKKTFLD